MRVDEEIRSNARMSGLVSRRRMVEYLACATALLTGSCTVLPPHLGAPRELPEPSPEHLPRWRGFNLVEKYHKGRAVPGRDRFREADFAWIAEWGFNFVRIPLDYRFWIDGGDWTRFDETGLREIDEAVELGRKHRIHVQLNFHRAPGYTVARPAEARSLWSDEEAQRVCALHWRAFARRYRGRPNRAVSFNLFNEPSGVDPLSYRRVVQRISEAIREEDETRLVVCDGRDYGRIPPDELLGLKVAAATRGYEPFGLTHYRAGWVAGSDGWPEPVYPQPDAQGVLDAARLQERWIAPWQALEREGIGVMVGEFGAYNRTGHRVVLAWMEDVLGLWRNAGWGWALWNLRGEFGILDSGRSDVAYEDWHGHELDRTMLTLLQRF